jgi:hypothetical protein
MNGKRESTDNNRRTRGEVAARVFLLVAGGVLLSILVSCACGPMR